MCTILLQDKDNKNKMVEWMWTSWDRTLVNNNQQSTINPIYKHSIIQQTSSLPKVSSIYFKVIKVLVLYYQHKLPGCLSISELGWVTPTLHLPPPKEMVVHQRGNVPNPPTILSQQNKSLQERWLSTNKRWPRPHFPPPFGHNQTIRCSSTASIW